jgi:hypothetical protein
MMGLMIAGLVSAILCAWSLAGEGTLQRVFTISVKDAAAYDALKVKELAWAGTTYDAKLKTVSFTANECPGPSPSWRLIHDEKRVLDLFHSGGLTTTAYRLFEASTSAECLAEIKRLGLIDNREFKEEEMRSRSAK